MLCHKLDLLRINDANGLGYVRPDILPTILGVYNNQTASAQGRLSKIPYRCPPVSFGKTSVVG